jgi:Methyltransferase domain/R3H domain
MIPDSSQSQTYTIVDFAGGSGHLSIPLALLLPHCHVIVVDLKAHSLQMVHTKALQFSNPDVSSDLFSYPRDSHVTQHDRTLRPCHGIPNLSTYQSSIEEYSFPFDLGISLHACGEASDWVLRVCGQCAGNAAPLIMAPCCVGKLNRKVRNPYIYHATGQNLPTLTYPQSNAFQMHCQENSTTPGEWWDVLARAAEHSDGTVHMRSSRHATRRTAKALLEMDRLEFLQEQYGYQTAMVRMDPWEASPKHDILLAWKLDEWSPFRTCGAHLDEESNSDVQSACNYLLETDKMNSEYVDWTREEQLSVEDAIVRFLQSSEPSYVFPTRMGNRKRKLIHYVAHQFGLRHWPVGDKDSMKTVAVAKIQKEFLIPQSQDQDII